jgi:hypothetical protein
MIDPQRISLANRVAHINDDLQKCYEDLTSNRASDAQRLEDICEYISNANQGIEYFNKLLGYYRLLAKKLKEISQADDEQDIECLYSIIDTIGTYMQEDNLGYSLNGFHDLLNEQKDGQEFVKSRSFFVGDPSDCSSSSKVQYFPKIVNATTSLCEKSICISTSTADKNQTCLVLTPGDGDGPSVNQPEDNNNVLFVTDPNNLGSGDVKSGLLPISNNNLESVKNNVQKNLQCRLQPEICKVMSLSDKLSDFSQTLNEIYDIHKSSAETASKRQRDKAHEKITDLSMKKEYYKCILDC